MWSLLWGRRVRNAVLSAAVGLMAFAGAGVVAAVVWAMIATKLGGPMHGGWRGQGLFASSDELLPGLVIVQMMACAAACWAGRYAASWFLPYTKEDERYTRRHECAGCRYPLRGVEVRCPECGRGCGRGASVLP